jgi:hypothetical protein
MVRIPRLFGCYDPSVLKGLENATDAFAPTLDAMSCAGASMCGHTPAEMSGLLAQAKPQEKVFIDAVNVYAAQFGGEQMPKPR